MPFQYSVVPFQGQQGAQAAAQQLGQLIAQHAEQGWEFVSVETIDTYIAAGCIASLLGARSTVISHNVVIFRAPK